MIKTEEAIKALELCRNTRTVVPKNEVLDYTIQALEEIQQYRAIGTVEEFKAYEDLEEQGKLLRLPCKVGDRFWMFHPNCLQWGEYRIECVKCVDMFIDLWEGVDSRCFFKDKDGTRYNCLFADFEKNVFLTKEEAEATLDRMKGE